LLRLSGSRFELVETSQSQGQLNARVRFGPLISSFDCLSQCRAVKIRRFVEAFPAPLNVAQRDEVRRDSTRMFDGA
jgi:hypothetical protein